MRGEECHVLKQKRILLLFFWASYLPLESCASWWRPENMAANIVSAKEHRVDLVVVKWVPEMQDQQQPQAVQKLPPTFRSIRSMVIKFASSTNCASFLNRSLSNFSFLAFPSSFCFSCLTASVWVCMYSACSFSTNTVRDCFFSRTVFGAC